MKKYFISVLLWLDEGLNIILFPFIAWVFKVKIPAIGNPHYTMSDVFAEARERGSKIGCVMCKFCNWLFRVKDHCKDAMTGMPEDEGMYG